MTSAPTVLSASERAAQINSENPDSGFRLVEDAAFWAADGIHTGAQLDRYLLEETYRNLYKEVRGFNDRSNLIDTSDEALSGMIEKFMSDLEDAAEDDGICDDAGADDFYGDNDESWDS